MQILKYCYALCKIRKKRLLHLKSLPQSTLYKIDQELNSTYVISQNGLTVTQNYIFSFGMADVYSIHDIECLQLKQEVNFTLYFSLLNSDVLLYIQEYHTNKKGIIKAQNDINTWSQIITLRMLFNKLSLKLFYDFFKKGRAKVSLSHGLYDSYVAIKLTYQMYPLMLDIRI